VPDGVPGLSDLLPDEAEALRAIQEATLAEMARWGYRGVVTPMLESLDALALGLGDEHRRRLFKLTDRDGGLLALVGERTVPVARMVATRMRSAALPLRLCYAGPVLTNDSGRFARRRESHQTGAELIGASGPVADAEVIALAVRCLAAAGLQRYQVDVGHAEFFQGLLEGLDVSDEIRLGIRAALVQRDFVELAEILDRTPLQSAERELLLRFPALRGGPEILDVAAGLVRTQRSARALEQLAAVHRLLGAHGLAGRVSLDLGAIRDFDYYTGIIFEGYGPDLGRPLAQGGRYDRLLAHFGRPAHATGFVLHLDLIAEARQRAGDGPARARLDAAVGWGQRGLEGAVALGAGLRRRGLSTVVATEPRSYERCLGWAEEVGAANLLHLIEEDRVRWRLSGGEERRLDLERAIEEVSAG
jgi:ATP phosphoribosyltransferase regulatory subunit